MAREVEARAAARVAPPARVRAPLLRPGARLPRQAARRLAAWRARRSTKAPPGRCRGRALRPRCRPRCRDLPQPGGSRDRPLRRGPRGRRARGSDAPRQRSTTMSSPQPLSSPELSGLDRVSHLAAPKIRACPSARIQAAGVIQSNTVRHGTIQSSIEFYRVHPAGESARGNPRTRPP